MPLPWSSENPCGNEDGVARAGNPRQAWTRPSPPPRWDSANSSSSEESSAGDGSGAGSDSEPDPSPARRDLDLLRLLPERRADIQPLPHAVRRSGMEPALSGRLAAKPTAYAALSTYCTGAAANERTLGPALNGLRGRRLVHQLPRGCLTI